MKIKWDLVYSGVKMPRKIKKNVLGGKMSIPKLRKRIQAVKVSEINSNEIELSDMFCPSCGCDRYRTVDHPEINFPEIWIEDFCLRCKKYVGGADNSFYKHVLEKIKGRGMFELKGRI